MKHVEGLHFGSGSTMKLYSTCLASLWLQAAGSGPQQVEGKPPDKESVYDFPSQMMEKPLFSQGRTSEITPHELSGGLGILGTSGTSVDESRAVFSVTVSRARAIPVTSAHTAHSSCS